MHTTNRRTRSAISTVLLTSAALSASTVASASKAPPSNTASPDVYKVIAEDKWLRVIIGTWKPGQRDEWHSHPITLTYWLADCDARVYLPDGTYRDRSFKTGESGVQAAVESHSFENRSSTECKAVMVEEK